MTRERAGAVLYGVFMGSLYTYIVMEIRHAKVNSKLVEDLNLRTDLCNWMVTEGIYLPEEEFFPQFRERASFINIVSKGP